jgi:HEAT repeat protein
MAERRGYYTALTQMKENAGIIIDYLSHPIWYVARNAADLCGDMDLVEAIPELAKRIHHEDERVRRSVAGALAKLGTSQAMEPIRQMLRDPAAPVRLEALMHLDGRRRGRSIGMVLAALLERETHTDVRREMLRTLGRIGTPDTIQAILRAAQPEGKRFRGRPRSERLGAVGALALAGPAAVPALRTMVKDPDAEVARAAEEAIAMVSEQ